jgi:hypothetical protein
MASVHCPGQENGGPLSATTHCFFKKNSLSLCGNCRGKSTCAIASESAVSLGRFQGTGADVCGTEYC